jgi:hypothetical protein
MAKPQKTAADYMVIALSPALIMMLVGSLCFFLIEVFYRGKMIGAVCWVMFWFVIGIVLVARIAIEKSTEYAALYGLGLALATWLYMVRTQPSYLIGIVLLAVVWFCAHKLVWDCTLIDEDQDSSGQGLLQKAPVAAPVKTKSTRKPGRKISAPHSPGKWVIWFSLAALPLFGLGQMLLPAGAAGPRRTGFLLLAAYLAAALGLLLTTSFLGLRRYLRHRYLKMPAAVALAWLKLGVGVVVIALVGAAFLPRPGAREAWATLSYQIDYQLRRASEYASRNNAPGQGQGRTGNTGGGNQGDAQKPSQQQGNNQNQSGGQPNQSQAQSTSRPGLTPSSPAGQGQSTYYSLRTVLWVVAIGIASWWIFRRRYLLAGLLRSIIAAVKDFLRTLLDMMPSPKSAKAVENALVPRSARFGRFAEYKNPFFSGKDYAWPPEQIILYSYEAVRVWAKERDVAPRPEETAREFCDRLGGHFPEFASRLDRLAHLYAYAAYAAKVPPNASLEPIRELWRDLPTNLVHAAELSKR